jgi:foldase protein PrsA
MNRRYTRPVSVVLASLLVLASLVAAGCTPAPSKTAIAVVNGVEIPKAAVDSQIAQQKKASPQPFAAGVEQQYRAQILNNLIQLELIKEAAKSLGVAVTPKQVDDYITQLEQQYGGAAALTAAMTAAGFDMTTLRAQISSNLLAQAVGDKVTTGTVNVTDAQVQAYYAQHKDQYSTPAQVHAEHILLATKDKALAQSLFAQVKAGADFAALAKKNSIDPGSKTKGGDLGWAAATSYVKEFAAAVQKMKIGSVQLVKTQFGWHIIKLLGRHGVTQQTFAEASAQIRQTLEQTAKSTSFRNYIEGLQKKAKIEILDASLKKLIDANAAASSGTTATP